MAPVYGKQLIAGKGALGPAVYSLGPHGLPCGTPAKTPSSVENTCSVNSVVCVQSDLCPLQHSYSSCSTILAHELVLRMWMERTKGKYDARGRSLNLPRESSQLPLYQRGNLLVR